MRKIRQVDSPFLLDPEGLPRQPDKRVAWECVFARSRPLRIEVGVGNSPFLIEVARLEPDFNYLGFEYSRKRVYKFLRRIDRSGLENIRIVRVNATLILRDAIREGDVEHLFINFPDPWPKRRHAKKRFVQDGTIQPVVRLLRLGGGMSLRTDVVEYASQMVGVLDGCRSLENLSGPGNFAEAPRYRFRTAYEDRFLAEGRRIHYLEYRKVSPDAEG